MIATTDIKYGTKGRALEPFKEISLTDISYPVLAAGSVWPEPDVGSEGESANKTDISGYAVTVWSVESRNRMPK